VAAPTPVAVAVAQSTDMDMVTAMVDQAWSSSDISINKQHNKEKNKCQITIA
jgi:hypothetical protein